MLTVVLVFNLLVALICLYAALQVWRLRLSLAKVTDTLESIERSTHEVLDGAPEAIVKGQMGVYQLRQKYQQIGPQLQQVQKALALLSVGQFVWQQRSLK